MTNVNAAITLEVQLKTMRKVSKANKEHECLQTSKHKEQKQRIPSPSLPSSLYSFIYFHMRDLITESYEGVKTGLYLLEFTVYYFIQYNDKL